MQEFTFGTTDAILIGSKSESVFLFLHGNGGSKEEAIAFAQVAVPHGYQVIGIDVPVMGKPWKVLEKQEDVKDFLKKNYKSISIRARNILHAKRITLGVFCDNRPAFECYRSIGFSVIENDSYMIDGEEWQEYEMEYVVN